MPKKYPKHKEKSLVVRLCYVAAPDSDARLSRAMEILLWAAARGTSQAEDSPDADKENPSGRSTHEATGNGGCKSH